MSEYFPTIGLEIHAELATKTKMFCGCKNDSDETRPNANICPICMGHPGTLPVANREAIKSVLIIGTAVGGTIADFTEFDRKNYFYPDIPKGYQISQYKYPFVTGGTLRGVELTRIHLEEDTARSSHDTHPKHESKSLVDFNRAGVPLMELVTEPVIHSAEDASAFAKELQLLLQYLGVAHANMEKGEMRVEANISVSADRSGNPKKFGTKVEVKNLNSFRAVERAISYEIARHTKLLEEGAVIEQETRGWDETQEVTFSQRKKENSHDYRYFPEPDLPKMKLSELPEFSRDTLAAALPELPRQKRERYATLGLKPDDAEFFVRDIPWAEFFDAVVQLVAADPKKVSLATNYITSDFAGLVKKNGSPARDNIIPESFAALIGMIAINTISSRGAKDILVQMFTHGGSPAAIAEKEGLLQKSDSGELTTIAEQVIAANPTVVTEYKAGKQSAIQFFVGQGMKASKGSGNPEVLKKLFTELLGK